MDPRFVKMTDQLAVKLGLLLSMTPISVGTLPRRTPISGVYLFSEGERHLYVGRSNNLRRRYDRHTLPSARQNQAAFAFRLTREKTGHTKATYSRSEGGRKWLIEQTDFLAEFTAAKKRIRAMDYRYVEENDQVRQALLEIYVATVLETPYNDFGTH